MILLSAQVMATSVHEYNIATAYAMKLEAGRLLLSPQRLAPASTVSLATAIRNKLIVSSGINL
jgi:hypothetical protein